MEQYQAQKGKDRRRQRAKVFTKIGREIAVAVKEGGGNPASNSKLRGSDRQGQGQQRAQR